MITFYHMIGIVLTLTIIVGLSIYTGMSGNRQERKNGAPVVAGLIMGTLVGGSSTVGTAQLAYTYGMSAWWFTLGAGIGCLVLAFGFARPFRKLEVPTLIGMIGKEYGATTRIAASVLSSVGMFINIISQLLAATAVIAVVFPAMGIQAALLISAVFMALYVIFGGTRGAGMAGIVKLILLYIAMIGSGIVALSLVGGAGNFITMVNGIENSDAINFFSLFARGIGKDMGSCLSLMFGVLTTQTYAQALLSAKSDRSAVRGALISAVMIPPIGIGGILVGLYMRANDPGIVAKAALTTFVMEFIPPLLGGVILGTLFIAVVGTGAGLALGISSVVVNDLVKKLTHRFDQQQASAALAKIVILIVLGAAACLSAGDLGDTILSFAFMSMGLRGAVVFAPLCGALWAPGRIRSAYALAAVIAGPVCVLIGNTLLQLPFDALFLGMGVAAAIMLVGYWAGRLHPINVERKSQ